MRHAKSDWADESLSDHDRPLNRRGRDDAPRMADWMESIDVVPDLILCSSAKRTCQTVELMMQQWDSSPTVIYSERLYLASPQTIFNLICTSGGSSDRLMVVAHNPGMSSLVSGMVGEYREMATAAIAVFQTDFNDWKLLGDTMKFELKSLMRPKSLPQKDADDS